MQQLFLNFESKSPINAEKFQNQNRQVYEHFASGKTLTLLMAENLYGIRHLHSRISDLRNIHGVIIYDRAIRAIDRFGNKVK